MANTTSPPTSQPPSVIEAVQRGCCAASDSYLSPTTVEFAEVVLEELERAGYAVVPRGPTEAVESEQ